MSDHRAADFDRLLRWFSQGTLWLAQPANRSDNYFFFNKLLASSQIINRNIVTMWCIANGQPALGKPITLCEAPGFDTFWNRGAFTSLAPAMATNVPANARPRAACRFQAILAFNLFIELFSRQTFYQKTLFNTKV